MDKEDIRLTLRKLKSRAGTTMLRKLQDNKENNSRSNIPHQGIYHKGRKQDNMKYWRNV